MPDRPDVPAQMVERIDQILSALPQCQAEPAWVGTRWRVHGSTVAHVFGGEDQRFRISFRAEPDEVAAYEHSGEPYYRAGWGDNVVGMLLDGDTDWTEVGEALLDSYCLQAPQRLAEMVARPEPR